MKQVAKLRYPVLRPWRYIRYLYCWLLCVTICDTLAVMILSAAQEAVPLVYRSCSSICIAHLLFTLPLVHSLILSSTKVKHTYIRDKLVGIATGYELDNRVRFRTEQDIILFLPIFQADSGVHPASYQIFYRTESHPFTLLKCNIHIKNVAM
jgi:hypothetical protein